MLIPSSSNTTFCFLFFCLLRRQTDSPQERIQVVRSNRVAQKRLARGHWCDTSEGMQKLLNIVQEFTAWCNVNQCEENVFVGNR